MKGMRITSAGLLALAMITSNGATAEAATQPSPGSVSTARGVPQVGDRVAVSIRTVLKLPNGQIRRTDATYPAGGGQYVLTAGSSYSETTPDGTEYIQYGSTSAGYRFQWSFKLDANLIRAATRGIREHTTIYNGGKKQNYDSAHPSASSGTVASDYVIHGSWSVPEKGKSYQMRTHEALYFANSIGEIYEYVNFIIY